MFKIQIGLKSPINDPKQDKKELIGIFTDLLGSINDKLHNSVLYAKFNNNQGCYDVFLEKCDVICITSASNHFSTKYGLKLTANFTQKNINDTFLAYH